MPKLKDNFTNILNKLITDKNISEAEFRILCYLLMRAGKQDVCYPSLNTISKDTDIGLSTVTQESFPLSTPMTERYQHLKIDLRYWR